MPDKEIDLTHLKDSQGFYIRGVDRWGLSGFKVSGAGDINNDGYNDIIVGAKGISYVIYGGKSLNNINLGF